MSGSPDSPLPTCMLCGKHVHAKFMGKHANLGICLLGQSRCENRLKESLKAREAQRNFFSVEGEDIQRVTQFQYLVRPIRQDDRDDSAIRYNVMKAQAKWQMFSRILTREGAKPRVMGMFYKGAVVQSILLYGSKTWCITLQKYDILNLFHDSGAKNLRIMVLISSGDRFMGKAECKCSSRGDRVVFNDYLLEALSRIYHVICEIPASLRTITTTYLNSGNGSKMVLC